MFGLPLCFSLCLFQSISTQTCFIELTGRKPFCNILSLSVESLWSSTMADSVLSFMTAAQLLFICPRLKEEELLLFSPQLWNTHCRSVLKSGSSCWENVSLQLSDWEFTSIKTTIKLSLHLMCDFFIKTRSERSTFNDLKHFWVSWCCGASSQQFSYMIKVQHLINHLCVQHRDEFTVCTNSGTVECQLSSADRWVGSLTLNCC